MMLELAAFFGIAFVVLLAVASVFLVGLLLKVVFKVLLLPFVLLGGLLKLVLGLVLFVLVVALAPLLLGLGLIALLVIGPILLLAGLIGFGVSLATA